MSLDNIFKENIFEYKITGLVSINKDNQKNNYERAKQECPNCETKLLFNHPYGSEKKQNEKKID